MFYGNYIKKFLVGYLVKDRLGVIAQGGFFIQHFPITCLRCNFTIR